MLTGVILQQLANGLVTGFGYVLVALGLTLIFGILDIINFAHGEFYMLGAYVTALAIAALDIPYLLAAILSLLFVIMTAYLLNRLTLRRALRQGDPFITLLLTFAWSLLMVYTMVLLYGTTPRRIDTPFTQSVTIGPVFLSMQKLIAVACGVLIVAGVHIFLSRTFLGKALRATAQNRTGAQALGLDIERISTVTFVLGVGLAAVAGILLGPTANVVPTMGLATTIKGFVVVVLGGMGSIPGAIIGGLGLGVVETLSTMIVGSAWQDVIAFSILIVTMLVMPSGLFGVKGRVA